MSGCDWMPAHARVCGALLLHRGGHVYLLALLGA